MKKLIFLSVFTFCALAFSSCADQNFEELTSQQEAVGGGASGGDDHEDEPE